jgi:hypothetical protein
MSLQELPLSATLLAWFGSALFRQTRQRQDGVVNADRLILGAAAAGTVVISVLANRALLVVVGAAAVIVFISVPALSAVLCLLPASQQYSWYSHALMVAPFLLVLALVFKGQAARLLSFLKTPQGLTLSLAYAWLAMRFTFGDNPELARNCIAAIVAGMGFFGLTVWRPRHTELALSGAAWAAISLNLFVDTTAFGYARYEGISGNPNLVAESLLFGVTVCAPPHASRAKRTVMMACYSVPAFLLLLRTESAQAGIMFPVVVGLAFALMWTTKPVRALLLGSVLGTTCALVVSQLAVADPLLEKILSFGGGDASGRAGLQMFALTDFLQSPILGNGQYYVWTGFSLRAAHNAYLTVLSASGVVGLALWLAVAASTIGAIRVGKAYWLVPGTLALAWTGLASSAVLLSVTLACVLGTIGGYRLLAQGLGQDEQGLQGPKQPPRAASRGISARQASGR